MRESFVNEVYFKRWVDCCEDALQCCQKMQQSVQEVGSGLCPALWDGWTCFSSAPAGTTVEYPCPIYAYSGQGPKCTRKNKISDKTLISLLGESLNFSRFAMFANSI